MTIIIYFLMVTGIYFSLIFNVLANEPWSFEKHPQPADSELTIEERFAFKIALDNVTDRKLYCKQQFGVEYSIYLKRYPEYLAAFDEREQVKQWRQHIASNPEVQGNTCLYEVIQSELEEINLSPEIGEEFMFCGLYSREPENRTEARAKRLIDEVITYAHFGSQKALQAYGNLFFHYNFIHKPDELQYYFARLTDNLHPSEKTKEDLKIYGQFLTRKTIQRLDVAAATKNYQAVLDVLYSCDLKDKKRIQKLYKDYPLNIER